MTGLRRGSRRGGADARRRAGDEKNRIGHSLSTACTIGRASTFRPAPAATDPSASAARPTCPAAVPTAATAAGAATSCSCATTRCAIWSPIAVSRSSRRAAAATARDRCATAPTARRWSSPVPPGTEAVLESDGTRHDFVRAGQRALVARGGPGGRGNKRFAGPTHQTPRFAERGLPGDEGWLTLQLKLLADVGLIGLPNAGKSSLLARITRATPKVAGYPVHHALAGARHAGDRDPPAGDRRHPGPDRGRQRGRRARPRVPRPRRAHAAARPRAGPGAAGRLGSGRQPRHDRARAGGPRSAAGLAAAGAGAVQGRPGRRRDGRHGEGVLDRVAGVRAARPRRSRRRGRRVRRIRRRAAAGRHARCCSPRRPPIRAWTSWPPS